MSAFGIFCSKTCFYAFFKIMYYLQSAEYLSKATVLSQQWRLQLSENLRVQMQQGNIKLHLIL